MTTIENLLRRRPDLSTFIVHFTRDLGDRAARDNIVSILSDRCLTAGSKHGKAKDYDVPNQDVVCFTETPLEHAWTLVAEIEGRQVPLRPYGVVFTKIWARRRGVEPCLVYSATPGRDWVLSKSIDSMMKRAIESGNSEHEIFSLAPLIEVMGTWPTTGRRSEFWWEREWRTVGDMTFSWDDLVAVFAPEEEHSHIRTELQNLWPDHDLSGLKFLDTEWGLERMIGSLAGVYNGYLGPLPRFR